MNAVIYARYSSLKQDENTIEAQIRYCQEYCERNHYSVVGEYIDRATSASSHIEKRTNFLKMISDSNKHSFDAVIVFKLDRFARNRYDSATYKAKLKKNNVVVLSATENISNDKESIILESVLEGMAEYFSKDLAEKVISGMREAALRCQYVGGFVPYGYKIVDKQFVLDDEKAPIVKECFERFDKGEPIVNLIRDLNKRHIVAPRGKEWNKNSFHNMFANYRYTGKYIFQDIVIENGIPSIVDKKLFERVNEKMSAKKKTYERLYTKGNFLLSCKLVCGECGKPIYGRCGTSKSGKKYYYYQCDGNAKHKCNLKPIPKDQLELLLCDNLKSNLTPELIELVADKLVEQVNQYNKENNQAELLEQDLQDKEKRIENLMASLEIYRSESVLTRIKQLELDKKEIERALEYANRDKIHIEKDMVLFYFDKLLSNDIEDLSVQKNLLSIVCDKARVFHDRVEVDYIFNIFS